MAGVEGQSRISVEDAGVIPLGKALNHYVGATSTLLTRPTLAYGPARFLRIQVLQGSFRVKLGDFSARTFTAAAFATGTLSTGVGHQFQTGDGPYRVGSSTTLPSGLSAGTDYWITAANTTTGTFKLASSKANAIAGVNVTLSDAGTGTHTIDGMDSLVAVPSVSVTSGDGSWALSGAGSSWTCPAPEAITIRGFSGTDAADYYFV
jgi:hypothetical protein